jgi:Protein of unknown function (DUF2786)
VDKAEAMAKIRGLEALAARPELGEGEKEAALNRAAHLKSKYGITDAQMAASAYVEVDSIFGGKVKVFPYYDQVGVKLKHIKDLVALAEEAIDGIEDLADRMRYSCQFYKELRQVVEVAGPYWRSDQTVKAWRDDAIKAFYQAKFERYLTLYTDDEGDQPALDRWYAHADAVREVKYNNGVDLREDTIENVVGVKGKDLWAKVQKEGEERRARQAQLEEGTG